MSKEQKQNTGEAAAKTLTISPPNFQTAEFTLIGTAPLVVHRMSEKYRREQLHKITTGKPAGNKKNREAQNPEDICNEARYVAKEGWDGVKACCFRNALISACKICGYPMTRAKMSFFILEDGYDAKEPSTPLVRIHGKSVMQTDVVRMANGDPNLSFRPAYHDWKMKLRIRFDADQFTLNDTANLLARVGIQVGIGEGRPDSTNSGGMGWGTFSIAEK